jgi:hypothetical protein
VENSACDEQEEKRKTNFTDIPTEVLRLIFDLGGYSSLTATNRYFYDVRRHLFLKLNKTYSRKYYDDEHFQTLVHSRLENPTKQLSLDLSGCIEVTDVTALGGIHSLNLSYCYNITDVSALGGVHTLDLRGCGKITDVSALGGVHTLTMMKKRKDRPPPWTPVQPRNFLVMTIS